MPRWLLSKPYSDAALDHIPTASSTLSLSISQSCCLSSLFRRSRMLTASSVVGGERSRGISRRMGYLPASSPLLQALAALLNIPDKASRAVFAVQLRVPAPETFVAQPDSVLQALEACLSLRMAGAFSHAAIPTGIWADQCCVAGGPIRAKSAVRSPDARSRPFLSRRVELWPAWRSTPFVQRFGP